MPVRPAVFAVMRVTANLPSQGHDAGVECRTKAAAAKVEPAETGGRSMKTNMRWKPALLALMGVVAVATVGLASNADGRGVAARSEPVGAADCNIHDPLSVCFDLRPGYPAGDLYILEDYF
jgi:hypothetical protein